MNRYTEQITPGQLLMMVVISRLGLSLVFFGSNPTIQQDTWWQSMVAVLLGILLLIPLNRLWMRFPRKTFPMIAQRVLGRPLGRLLALAYATFLLLILCLTLRTTGEVFVFAFLPRTPIVVIMGVVAFLAVWGARAGVEVVARASQFIFPILMGSVLLIFILLWKDIRFELLWPPRIMSVNPIYYLNDMVGIFSRTVEFTWVGLLVPYVNKPQKGWGALVGAQLWLGLIWGVMSVTVYGVLGFDVAAYYFPYYTAAQVISIAEFLERIDGVLLAIWLLGMMVRTAMLLWGSSVFAAHGLGLRNYRRVTIPLAAIAVPYALAQADSFPEIQGYIKPESFTPFTLTFVLLIPLLVLAVATLRGLRGRPKGTENPGLHGQGT